MQPGPHPASVATASAPAAVAPPYAAALTISGGAWRSTLAQGGRVVLARPQVYIGRLAGNSVELLDPAVSRHHAVIRWGPQGYELEDLGSANGTYVQGQRVAGRVALAPGYTIRIGTTEMHFAPLSVPRRGPTAPPLPPGAAYATPLPPGATPAAAPQPYTYYPPVAMRAESLVRRVIRSEAPKRYWRVLLVGLVAYAAVSAVLTSTGNLHLVPLVLLLASALVPVVFVLFCWEQNAFADMPPAVVGVTFLSGAVLGLTLAAVVEPFFLAQSAGAITLGAALAVGVVEEGAKVASVLWFLRDRRLRSELDGLILGAAAGMGFAALETAGYGFVAFLAGFAQALAGPTATLGSATSSAVGVMNQQLLARMALAIFGHGVWTAMVCAAIWRERNGRFLRITPGVIATFGLAVVLHALWDWAPVLRLLPPQGDALSQLIVLLAWFLAIGAVGLFALRFFLRESLARARLGPTAPPPPPLLQAVFGGGRGTGAAATARMPAVAPVEPPAAQPFVPPSAPPMSPQVPAVPATPTTAPRPMYCPRCRLTYAPGAMACGQCGGPLMPLP